MAGFQLGSYAREVAIGDPQLALWLLRTAGSSCGAGTGLDATKYSTDYAITCDFRQPQPGQTVDGVFSNTSGFIPCDFFVYSMVYTVRQVNAYPGDILVGQQVNQNKINSGIDVRLVVQGCYPRILTDGHEPLELACTPAGTEEDNPHRFVIGWGGGIEANFRWNKPVTSNDIPTRVVIRVRGIPLGCRQLGGLSRGQACGMLKDEFGLMIGGV
jgi:hypothetical protein